MGYWTLDDISWDRFDRAKVDPELLKVVKAASLVERNARDYAAYLCSVFADDPEVLRTTEQWAAEEVQREEQRSERAKTRGLRGGLEGGEDSKGLGDLKL